MTAGHSENTRRLFSTSNMTSVRSAFGRSGETFPTRKRLSSEKRRGGFGTFSGGISANSISCRVLAEWLRPGCSSGLASLEKSNSQGIRDPAERSVSAVRRIFQALNFNEQPACGGLIKGHPEER